MIVVGLDVHKHSLTAVAVDELGRTLAARSGPVDAQILDWASGLEAERLWALEDCRHVTRTLERALLGAGERLVRVPPRLTAPQRRGSRTRGKSDAIDALAIARAALQEPGLEGPRPDEESLRELKLLVDHRDDLVGERRRCQQRLRWHLHELDPALHVPLGGLDRTASQSHKAAYTGQRGRISNASRAKARAAAKRSAASNASSLAPSTRR
jgi:transposase